MSKQIKINTPVAQLANLVNDGDEFVLMTRKRQSEEFQVWSSGDEQTTHRYIEQATRSLTPENA